MQEQIQKIREQAEREINGADCEMELEDLRVKYLGKKGQLTDILKQMGKLSPKERPVLGQAANTAREFLESLFSQKCSEIAEQTLYRKLLAEKIDVTLPGKGRGAGNRHPIFSALREVEEIFLGMGFSFAEGPEVELDYYNFEALNMPENHPARSESDTFYIDDKVVLRSSTSTVQIRTMEKTSPPIRIISPGRVFRADEVDATHSPVFYQFEGLYVDRGVNFADLKATLEMFFKKFFGEDAVTRLRPHYFPFTEPSAEMDLRCLHCGGVGCGLCKGEGWIEILGCGMVHRQVLHNCGIDPDVFSGFAFGVGLQRLAMFKYNIKDTRLFFENDIRFLQQF